MKRSEFNPLENQILKDRIRPLVRDILRTEVANSKEFKAFLNTNITRTAVMNQFNQIFQEVIDHEILKMIDSKLKKRVYEISEIYVKEYFSNLDISTEVKKAILPHLKSNFKGVIQLSMDASFDVIRNRINKRLSEIINLKTSTIQEIQRLTEFPIEHEESMRFLQNEFVEYYEQIKMIESGNEK